MIRIEGANVGQDGHADRIDDARDVDMSTALDPSNACGHVRVYEKTYMETELAGASLSEDACRSSAVAETVGRCLGEESRDAHAYEASSADGDLEYPVGLQQHLVVQ